MGKHLKPLSAPKFWKVAPKQRPWVVKPRPGPHRKFESIPLLLIVREFLELADTYKEGQSIIKAREIIVDGKARRDHKYPVGLMDVIHIPKIKKSYRIVPFRKGLKLLEIPSKQANLKLCRIKGKTVIRGGKLQLNLHDGRSIVVDTKKDEYKTGDSVLIELPSQKIIEHIKLEKGNLGIITGGQNKGEFIKVKSLKKTRSREPNKVVCELKDREFDAVKDYVFMIGTKKPVIKLSD
jgi:small subunit ribosomal protein S4e